MESLPLTTEYHKYARHEIFFNYFSYGKRNENEITTTPVLENDKANFFATRVSEAKKRYWEAMESCWKRAGENQKEKWKSHKNYFIIFASWNDNEKRQIGGTRRLIKSICHNKEFLFSDAADIGRCRVMVEEKKK